MSKRSNLSAWIAQRAKQDDELYEEFGRQLESEHSGELVAISDAGRLILGKDELALTKEALTKFGAGKFALRRIGADAEIRWRRPY